MKVFSDYNDELRVLEDHIKGQARPGEVLQVLEAGCGREWYFKLDGIQYELTGLDLDAAALAARRANKGDMQHSFVGDLRTAKLESGKYSVIYNAFVLEHVQGAEQVLENFASWLKPGGIMIVRVPDRNSVQGFVARCTPHWLHVLYYRWAWKMKDAGKPGFAPYPTIYDDVVSPQGLKDFCARHGLDVVDEIGVGSYRRGYGMAARLTPVIAKLITLATFGSVHSRYVDYALVARKR
jgi:SAM-dependent methyltransferase